MRRTLQYLPILLATAFLTEAAGMSAAAEVRAWQAAPVLSGGRIVPLDTYARAMADSVCGRQNPKLWLTNTASAAEKAAPAYAEAKKLFPDGKPRHFTAAELLFSWLVEPQRWHCVPFLTAAHKQLRREILDLPSSDDVGRLRFVSPYEAEHNRGLNRRWAELSAREASAALGGADRKIEELAEGLARFRAITETPADDPQPPKAHLDALHKASVAWRQTAGALQAKDRLTVDDPLGKLVLDAGGPLQKLLGPLQAMAHGQDDAGYSWKDSAEAAEAFALACRAIAAKAARDDAVPADLAAELKRTSLAAALALYERAESPRVVPSLDAQMYEEDRDPQTDNHPWISLSVLLDAPQPLLADYPQAELSAVRREFAAAKAVWLAPGGPDHAAEAIDRFAAALRALGEKTTALRGKLPLQQKDERVLAETAYPPPGALNAELFYNRLDPFFWSWILSAVAAGLLALSLGVVRRPLFWLGMFVLLGTQLMTLSGFALRTYITGWLPLTGMFESVALVGLGVALLGTWFTLLPVVWPGLRLGWQRSAFPLRRGEAGAGTALGWLAQGPKLAVAASLLWVLSLGGCGWPVYFDLLPRRAIGAALPSLDNVIVWAVGLAVLLGMIYLASRFVATLALCPWAMPAGLRREGFAHAADAAVDRKILALVGAVLGCLAALLAYYAPSTILDRDITRPQPVLRDNFWLFTHVLTIFASYSAGALAWGLSNIALLQYLFGAYRSFPADAGEKEPARLPPIDCAALAQLTYKAIQVAVLLLVAGIILGALWADKSWGRFWSWDSKEVWSLLTLLAYMVLLHGRHIGWFGNFALAVGSVAAGAFIVVTWFGVNLLLTSGLHSYGAGAANPWLMVAIAAVVGANGLLAGAAAGRYLTETARR